MFGFNFGRLGAVARAIWLPSRLFANNEVGAWYDPSDFSTLYQDSAGTTPVTAVEQPVGLMLDKSGNGKHATQATSASRPVLSQRVNLLTKTEKFDDAAVWLRTGTVAPIITANQAIAPNGELTADEFDLTPSGDCRPNQNPVIANITETIFTVWLKAKTTAGTVALRGRKADGTWADLLASVTTDWQKFTLSIPASTGVSSTLVYVGNRIVGGTCLNFYAWGASLVPADQASLPYQWVDTATSYDTSAVFPKYLKCDGVDDSMATAAINFTGTDKIFVGAAIRKLSDAARGMVVELSATDASNNGSFALTAPNSAAGNYAFESKGTALTDAVAATYAAPITAVVSGLGSIAADSNLIRVNGVQIDSDSGDQGTGNYGTYPVYIGRRGGTTLPFSGRIYGMIIRGALNTEAQTKSAESYLAQKCGVTI